MSQSGESHADAGAQGGQESLSRRYELLHQFARDIVLFLDREGLVLDANQAAVDAYGYAPGELLGINVSKICGEEARGIVADKLEGVLEKPLLFETIHRRKDGTTFPVEVSARSADIGGDRLILAIVRDLSERSELQANLLQADRMAAVGTLAAGVAHEINNPLAYAIANLDVLARRMPGTIDRLRASAQSVGPDEAPALERLANDLVDASEMLAVAREGVDRVRSIVRDLKTFSRADDVALGPIDVHEVLDSSIGIALNEIRHRAQLSRDYGAVPLVEINESRLGQVFLNLLVNAAQAIPEGRAEAHTIRVRTSTDERGRAVIEVADDGVGIPRNLLNKVFDPFMTTKPVGEGTGLGLFVSRSIIKAAGGEITMESEVGKGTRVRLVLPPAPPRPARDPTLSGPPSSGFTPVPRARVLVIDDEPALGPAVRGLFAGEHDVVVAVSGREALARLVEDPDFDMILCDLMMPDLTGMDLFEEVKAIRPELGERFVFMTGGALTGRAEEFFKRYRNRCIQKPFDLKELRSLVRARKRTRISRPTL
jgi:two-component system, cell cycle sensor histidine kinase and response regulator CckA